VSVTGPGGFSVSSPTDGSGLETSRAVIIPSPEENTTYVFVNDPRPGGWRIDSADPASPLRRVRLARGLPDPSVTARVRRSGRRYRLSYTVRPIPGQKVTFTERGDGVARPLGRARGRRGTIRFSATAIAPDRHRTIMAEVAQNGVPRELLTVARFTAPRQPKLTRPRLKATRSGLVVRLNWNRVRRADRYLVEVRAGKEVLYRLLTRKRKVRFTGVPATGKLTVSVEAQSDLLPPGRPARLRLRRPRR
jgi:hypothetical protein